ncbi:hypothetical protein [Friedmanniella luteola]|uniref:hypothetical protein n=1 Tax=Friedmanniella luteola TaxID=546871 RepID=UPI0018D43D4B|nr:hypothetical protein [Friedmanniella luteola]
MELFFDLVFVYAMSQVTELVLADAGSERTPDRVQHWGPRLRACTARRPRHSPRDVRRGSPDNVAFTLTRYGGLFEDGSDEAVDRLHALLRSRVSRPPYVVELREEGSR